MSRKTNRDHAKRQQRPMMEDEALAGQISALLTPALAKQKKYCRQLGLRDRILTLPLMVAAVLTMLWRDVGGVRELTRMLAREGFLWCDRLQVSQQALSNRFLIFPAELFERVFNPLFSQKCDRQTQKAYCIYSLTLLLTQSRETTVCGLSSTQHQNQLNLEEKAIYLA